MRKFAITTAKIMGRKNIRVDLVFAVGMLLMIGVLLLWKAPYRLNFKEQISIFLLGADRIGWYFSNPGIVSSIAGDWLTQFFINSVAGSVLSVLLLTVILAGLARFFRITEERHPVCLEILIIPVLLEAHFITFPNYPVSGTVGLALSVWCACALAHLKKSKYSPLIYGLSVPALFVIAGGHAFTTALMLAFMKRKDGFVSLLFIVLGIMAMVICGKMYNLTLLQTFIWPVWPGYILPHKALMLAMPWIILIAMILSLFYDKVVYTTWKNALLPSFCILITVFSSVVNDNELERTVKIGTLAYRNDWKEVRKMASSDKPNFYRTYYWNLCNAREGRLADDLLKGTWGRSSDVLFLSTGRGDPYFSKIYYTDALLEMGDVSQATDCALLAQTIMPGHYSTRMLRRLAEIAVVAGDYRVAEKYLNILLQTRNHRAWARELLDCLANDNIPEQYYIRRTRAATHDHFFAQGDIRSSLSFIAAESPYNRVAIDYLLCSYLLDKNINTFVSLYDKYYLNALDRMVTVPDLYQEALLVNATSMDKLIEIAQKYNISQTVADKYVRGMEARLNSEQPQNTLLEENKGTYWHYIMAMSFNNTVE